MRQLLHAWAMLVVMRETEMQYEDLVVYRHHNKMRKKVGLVWGWLLSATASTVSGNILHWVFASVQHWS